ncbi:MAG: hypothetical protein ACQEXX_31670 [Bacillota bacterium]
MYITHLQKKTIIPKVLTDNNFKANSEVITYQLSDEELAKYRNMENPKNDRCERKRPYIFQKNNEI